MGQPLSQRAHIQVKQIVISTLESIQIILAMGNKKKEIQHEILRGVMNFDLVKCV